jgi:tetratricopeptide (TPR) repeat protein
LACWLIFILLKKLTRTQLTAFLLTAIFAVHPVISQVVVWIPGRNDSLLTIFLTLSFISFIKYLDSKRKINAIVSLLLFFAALLIKELAVFFPILVVIYVLFFRNEQWKNLIIISVFWILLIIIWAAIRSDVLGMALGATNISEMVKSIWQNIPAIPGYIGKIFIPYGLSVYPNLKDMTIAIVIGSIFLLLLLATFLYKTAGKKLMLFGLLWFLIFLIPGFIKAVNMSEHRIYFPMIGILIFMAGTLKEIRVKWLPVFIIIWLVMISINISYSGSFKDRLTLWQQAVKSSPTSAFNANNLGAMYYLDNDFTNAEKYFRQAVQINPVEPLSNGNLGLVLMNTNKLNEAEIYLLQENKINPTYDNAYYNLGILYMKMGKTQLALEYMIKTISVNAGYLDAYRNLLNYYQQTNQPLYVQSVIDLAQKNGVKLN